METKMCKKCGENKELSMFRVRKDNKTGYGNNCKVCESLINKKYRENNKDKIKDKNIKFLKENPNYFKKRYNDIKKIISEKQKLYYLKNKKNILAYNKEYRIKNKNNIKSKQQNWYNKNKETIKKRIYKNYKKRIKSDQLFRVRVLIKNNIYHAIKKLGYTKKSRTQDILGCSFEQFKLHIEAQFQNWMNWGNYGLYNGTENYGWGIDHIIPLSSAKTEEDVIRLNHYTNLQPLCSYVNRVIKRNKES